LLGVNCPRNMCSNSSRSAQSGRPLALLSLVALLVLSFATVVPAVSGSLPAAAHNEAEMVGIRKLLESANSEVLKKSFFNFIVYNNTCTDERVSSTLESAKLDSLMFMSKSNGRIFRLIRFYFLDVFFFFFFFCWGVLRS
jgi:hypothetical protein